MFRSVGSENKERKLSMSLPSPRNKNKIDVVALLRGKEEKLSFFCCQIRDEWKPACGL